MNNWNINVYIALMNVLNHKNVFYYEYRSDGTIGPHISSPSSLLEA